MVGTLKRQLQGWADAHEHFIEPFQDENGKVGLRLARGDAKRMGRISITAGEVVYNLRAALDYVIYDLAMMASGKAIPRTQFPIEDTKAGFVSRITGKNKKGEDVGHFLKGVPAGAISLIGKMQPYAGCKWTRTLRSVSNPDKHQALSPLRSDADIRAKATELIPADSEMSKPSLRIKYDAEIEVFFTDGRPVLETLQMLCGEAEAAVALFKSRIKSK